MVDRRKIERLKERTVIHIDGRKFKIDGQRRERKIDGKEMERKKMKKDKWKKDGWKEVI